MPRSGSCQFDDHIRGNVEFQWSQEQDHVIQRADGTCLYHLASVVDDFDFQISHVIRAEEHLSNTPRQIFIAQSQVLPLDPVVMDMSPAHDTAGVPTASPLVINFSKSMNTASVEAAFSTVV